MTTYYLTSEADREALSAALVGKQVLAVRKSDTGWPELVLHDCKLTLTAHDEDITATLAPHG